MGVDVQNVAIAAILVGGLVVVAPLVTSGLSYSIVLTASMEPKIAVGDVVAIEPAEPEDIEVGDVMAFHAPGKNTNKPVIHRVVEIQREDGQLQFKTKGDNLEEKDPWTVQEEHVVGKVSYTIPRIGYIINLMRSGSRTMYILMIAGPAAALVYDELKKIWMDPEELDDDGSDDGPSWIEPYAQRLVDDYSDVSEDGVEQSMVAWLASQLLDEPYGPFRVVDGRR